MNGNVKLKKFFKFNKYLNKENKKDPVCGALFTLRVIILNIVKWTVEKYALICSVHQLNILSTTQELETALSSVWGGHISASIN